MNLKYVFILFSLTTSSLFGQQSDRLRIKLSGKVKTAVICEYQMDDVDNKTFLPKDTFSFDRKMVEYFNVSGALDSTVTYGNSIGGKETVSYRAIFQNDDQNRLKSVIRSHPESIFRNDVSKANYIRRKNSYTIHSFERYTEDKLNDSTIYYLDNQKRDSLIHSVSFGSYKSEYTMEFVYYGKDSAFSYKNTYTNLLKQKKYVSYAKNMEHDEFGNPTHICFFQEDRKSIQCIYMIRYTYDD